MSVVQLKNVFKSYGKSSDQSSGVLNGINMSVERGSIYSLIGASGCGKTTLLACLLGMQRFQNGEIQIFNKKVEFEKTAAFSNVIGYMPQHLALTPHLTIRETLEFYGNLHLMSRKHFEERLEFIMSLLNLPSRGLLIEQLSGGEQRRVSLAVALFHNPKLLILDEPTVGLDLELCHKIWDFLRQQSNENNLTVLITTHYLSEASKADRCGFMRKGVLLVEDNPARILESLNVETLDEAFYELSTKPLSAKKNANENDNSPVDLEEIELKTSNDLVKFQVIRGMLIAEYHRLKRQPLEVIMFFFLIAIQFFGFRYLIGGIPTDLVLGVVNNETNADCSRLNLSSVDCSSLSCAFLSQIDEVQKQFFKTEQEATEAFMSSKVFGIVSIGSNFTESLLVRDDGNESDSRHQLHELVVSLDNSRYPFLIFMKFKVFTAFQEFAAKVSDECKVNEHLAIKPFNFQGLYLPMSFETKETKALTGIGLPFGVLSLFSIFTFANSRTDGVWNRIILNGARMSEIIIANFIECTIFSVLLAIETLLSVNYITNVHIADNILLSLFLIAELAASGYLIGFFIALFMDDFRASGAIVLCINFLTMFAAGTIWPTEGFSPWIMPLTYIFPITLPIRALTTLIIKGSDIYHRDVVEGLISVEAWKLITLTASFLVLKRKKFSGMN